MEDAIIEGREQNATVVERFTLSNGVRVITEEIPWVSSVSLGFFILVGSIYEAKRLSGISHFLEHMVFKGSKKRSAKDIVMEIESLGGVINAATGKEFTHFFVRIYHKHLRKALDILTDLAFKPLLDKGDIFLEKGVVLEEIMMCEDNPDEFLLDRFHHNIYGDTSLGRKVLGNQRTVSSFTRNDLAGFHRRHYTPSNLVISAVGRLGGDTLRDLLEENFLNKRLGKPARSRRRGLPGVKPKYRPARFQLAKDVEQTTLILGYPSVSILNPDRYTFALIDAYLSGGMSSRLFQEVREKRGLVYSIDSSQSPLSRCGLYTIEAGMIGDNAANVAKVVSRELDRVVRKGVPPKALKNAREYMKGVMLLALESSTARMSRNAMNEIYFKRSIPLSELIENLESVKPSDTQTLAERIFDSDKLAVGILSSKDGKGKLDGILDAVCKEFKLN